MIKRYTKNVNFDLVLNAAYKLNIRFKRLVKHKNIGYFTDGRKQLYASNHWLGINNSISNLFAKHKFRTYKILDNKSLPHPKAVLINDKERLKDKLSKINQIPKPWVVKPDFGSEGIGISVGVDNEKELNQAYKIAKKHYKKVIVEEFVEGYHYRIYIFRRKILDIVERIPAYIIGNNEDSIKTLIKSKNQKRQEVGMAPIRVDEELRRQLKEKNLTLEDIPQEARKVELRKNCNLCAGGETKRIDQKKVHKDNLEMFVAATELLGLDLAGIDFITPDISKSFKKTDSAINEINRQPMPDAHYFADMKMDNFVAEEILKSFFEL